MQAEQVVGKLLKANLHQRQYADLVRRRSCGWFCPFPTVSVFPPLGGQAARHASFLILEVT